MTGLVDETSAPCPRTRSYAGVSDLSALGIAACARTPAGAHGNGEASRL